MNKDEIKLQWWRIACEKNPDPVAFVDLNDKFIFCNKAWCKLLGYSESELKQRRWQDITKTDDVGSDQFEVESIKKGDKEEYYLEKNYIRKDGSTVGIRLYVHKYPEEGMHEGYVVFARRITSEDYEDLKSKFLELQKTVLILQQNAIAGELIASQVSVMEEKIQHLKDLTKLSLEKHTSINIGDSISGDKSGNRAGRDNLIESNNNGALLIGLILGFLFLFIAIAILGLVIFLNSQNNSVNQIKNPQTNIEVSGCINLPV